VSARVVALTIAPVKGLRALEREEVALGFAGVRENRRFLLIDEQDSRMVNAKRHGALQTVVPDYDDAQRTLSLSFADGSVVAGAIESGQADRRPLLRRHDRRGGGARPVLASAVGAARHPACAGRERRRMGRRRSRARGDGDR
jgi:hypothetical protein